MLRQSPLGLTELLEVAGLCLCEVFNRSSSHTNKSNCSGYFPNASMAVLSTLVWPSPGPEGASSMHHIIGLSCLMTSCSVRPIGTPAGSQSGVLWTFLPRIPPGQGRSCGLCFSGTAQVKPHRHPFAPSLAETQESSLCFSFATRGDDSLPDLPWSPALVWHYHLQSS